MAALARDHIQTYEPAGMQTPLGLQYDLAGLQTFPEYTPLIPNHKGKVSM